MSRHLDQGGGCFVVSISGRNDTMTTTNTIPSFIAGTSLEEPIKELESVYGRIEAVQERWIQATPFRCPPGCGSCCETFEPDLSEIEALYLAAWILRNGPSLLSVIEGNDHRPGCVLADRERKYHCTAYGGRPLICRLFAFSGDRGKDGSGRFRPCKWMEEGGERRIAGGSSGRASIGASELMARYGVEPPYMSDFAWEVDMVLPNGAGRRRPLREALPSAAAKLRYLSDMADQSVFAGTSHDDDSPDGTKPTLPRVS